ncbi:MAG: DUF6527 family protein [Pyrinomonadaceae bacterium]
MKFELQHVKYMPKELEPHTLYVSEEFGTAAHLCACGCGSKIRTPLGPTEWNVEETKNGPSLYPSVGNWQKPCQSHYWINRGEIKWSKKWTDEKIIEGRRHEEERRRDYYNALDHQRDRKLRRFWNWVKNLVNRH